MRDDSTNDFAHFSTLPRCPPCNGSGRIECEVCKGHCRLKTFIQLTVTWYEVYKLFTVFGFTT